MDDCYKNYNIIKSFVIIIKRKTCLNNFISIKENQKVKSLTSKNSVIEIIYEPRNKTQKVRNYPSTTTNFLFGDDSELKDSTINDFLANGVTINLDLEKNLLEIKTSIVGLPPVYISKNVDVCIIASDINAISETYNIDLYMDLQSIWELGYIGHPVEYKTLYKEIEMVKPGSIIKYSERDDINVKIGWKFELTDPCKNWDQYLELQTDVFNNSIKNMDLTRSFISLTAGLDTRAIFASIAKLGLKIPAFTISGLNTSLDARIAGKLCRHYGNKHTVITINEDFVNDLPKLSYEASKCTGGISSLGQAHEVFFYKQVPEHFDARLSGNLGNQIGRFGTEGVSLRNAELSIINDSVLSCVKSKRNHWFQESNLKDFEQFYKFLLNKEIPFSSSANYSIGNYFLIQKSPYSNKKLVEIAQRIPTYPDNLRIQSIKKIVLNDLIHRFVGESNKYSFQLKNIRDVGGYVSRCPINWGMNAKKHMTLYGLFYGGLSLLDIILSKKSLGNEIIEKISKKVKIDGIHIFMPLSRIIKKSLKEFVIDTLSAKKIYESNLFNNKILEKHIYNFFKNNGRNTETIIFAMDLAIAINKFNARI
jgi:hypothetical protein